MGFLLQNPLAPHTRIQYDQMFGLIFQYLDINSNENLFNSIKNFQSRLEMLQKIK